MTTHNLKTWPTEFQASRDGYKLFEVRKNDRDFQLGDTIISEEWNPGTKKYTGRRDNYRVTYIIKGGSWGIPFGLCVMGIVPNAMAQRDKNLAEFDEYMRAREFAKRESQK